MPVIILTKESIWKVSRESTSYPVSHHHCCCCRTGLWPFYSYISQVHIPVIVQHIACDSEKWVHPLVPVAQSAGRIRTEARLVGINGDGITQMKGWYLLVDVCTQPHFRNKSRVFWDSHVVVFGWFSQHAGEVTSPRSVTMNWKVETLSKWQCFVSVCQFCIQITAIFEIQI